MMHLLTSQVLLNGHCLDEMLLMPLVSFSSFHIAKLCHEVWITWRFLFFRLLRFTFLRWRLLLGRTLLFLSCLRKKLILLILSLYQLLVDLAELASIEELNTLLQLESHSHIFIV